MEPSPSPFLRLLPTLRCARLGRHGYFYDEQASSSPVVFVPTRRVPDRAFGVVHALQLANPTNEPWPLDRWRSLFGDVENRAAVDVLARRGYLELAPATATPAGPEGREQAGPIDDQASRRGAFEELDLNHHFARLRAFGLPEEIDDDETDVALVGVPLASLPMSAGSALAPDAMRLFTTQRHLWFDVFKSGVMSELGVAGGLPEVLCKGVVLKDCGDLGFGKGPRTVGSLFADARAFVDDTLATRNTPALFFGGDHATTFPVLHALVQHAPDLCLIHLDAHHDLLCAERITYSHAAVVSNLLSYSDLKSVISLGVRGPADGRSINLQKLQARGTEAERVRLHSIGALKRMLGDPGGFDELLAPVGERPCYMTVDLDVLTPAAIGGQVTTPSGGGLEWWELIEVVQQVGARCRLIAADVVELNPTRGAGEDPNRGMLVTLLIHLIHVLARSRPER